VVVRNTPRRACCSLPSVSCAGVSSCSGGAGGGSAGVGGVGAAAGGFLSRAVTRGLFTRVVTKLDLCHVRLSPSLGVLYRVRSGRAALSEAVPFFSIEEYLRCLAHVDTLQVAVLNLENGAMG
jgi:hypothetical protein